MGELRLAIGTAIFVPKAFRNLEIALDSRYHQQLFKLLRGLGEGIEVACNQSAWHQIIASAFRRAFNKNRCFDFKEATIIEEIAHQFDHLMSKFKPIVHRRPSNVEVAIFQSHSLVRLLGLIVYLEGNWFTGIQNF